MSRTVHLLQFTSPGETKIVRVEVVIDPREIAKKLGGRAIRAKSGKATAMHGAVIVIAEYA